MKEIKEDTYKWIYICPMFMDQKKNTVKMFILSKAIYRLNEIPIKIPMEFSQKQKKTNKKTPQTLKKKTILKFPWKPRKPCIAKAILSNKTKLEALHCLISKQKSMQYGTDSKKRKKTEKKREKFMDMDNIVVTTAGKEGMRSQRRYRRDKW